MTATDALVREPSPDIPSKQGKTGSSGLAADALTAVIYCRISDDRDNNREGVDRQTRILTAKAEAEGHRVVAVLVDNNKKTHRAGTKREAYVKLKTMIIEGSFDRLYVQDVDRLGRNDLEHAELRTMLEDAETIMVTDSNGATMNPNDPGGMMMFQMKQMLSKHDNAHKAKKIRDAAYDRAERGRTNGYLGYGWRRVGAHQYVIDPEQADIVREAVRRLLAGDSIRAIRMDFNARGVPSPAYVRKVGAVRNRAIRLEQDPDEAEATLDPADFRWVQSSVQALVTRSANIGVREYRRWLRTGKPSDLVVTFAGTWPALIDKVDHDRVVDILSNPERRSVGPRPGRRKHVLTSGQLGRCGVCEGPLSASRRGQVDRYYLLCAKNHCVSRREDHVEEKVETFIVEMLSRPNAMDFLAANTDEGRASDVDQELKRLRAKQGELLEMLTDGDLDKAQYRHGMTRLEPKIKELEREYDQLLAQADAEVFLDLVGLDEAALTEAWRRKPVTGKRAVLASIGAVVRIYPTTKRGRGFDPDAVTITQD